jgi:hypothetical protein
MLRCVRPVALCLVQLSGSDQGHRPSIPPVTAHEERIVLRGGFGENVLPLSEAHPRPIWHREEALKKGGFFNGRVFSLQLAH